MIRILGRRTSGNVMKPLWAAEELGIEYEQVDIGGRFGGNRDPQYLALNPMGLVPTLVDGELVLWESNAITRYLAEKFGQGSLWPTDRSRRAVADQWMDWQQTAIAPMMQPIFWGLVRTPAEERDEARIRAGIERGIELWGMLDRHLAERAFVAGDAFTMGDIPLGPQVHRWLSLVEDRPSMPNLEAWYGRLTERPPFRKHVLIPIELGRPPGRTGHRSPAGPGGRRGRRRPPLRSR